jgi:hypothetical protein
VAISWLWAVQFFALAAVPSVLAIGVILAVASVAGPIFNVAFGNVVYQLTPDRLLGRVRSVAKAIAWGTIPLGSLAAGLLAAGIGAQPAIVALASILVLVALVATFAGGIRQIPGTGTGPS